MFRSRRSPSCHPLEDLSNRIYLQPLPYAPPSHQPRNILQWPGRSCVLHSPGTGESGARARPRRSGRNAALSCSAAVQPAPPCAGVRRTRLTLPRCGPAGLSIVLRSVGSTRFCISSKMHPISPSRTPSVATPSLRFPASLVDPPRHSCLGVRKHVAHPCSKLGLTPPRSPTPAPNFPARQILVGRIRTA
jgi:hypothetical protein